VAAVNLMPVETAIEQLLEVAALRARSRRVSLEDALGRALAEPLLAEFSVPGFDNSAMDGYAVNTADCLGAEAVLPVSMTIAAGHPIRVLPRGSAARIFTGAPVPQGADAVVMQESVIREKDGRVRLLRSPITGENLRRAGHDIAAGTEVLPAGKLLSAQDLGLAASLGRTSLCIREPLRVAIINTGDEVVAPGQPLRSGQIYDSNGFTLVGLLKSLGMEPVRVGIVADTLSATVDALQQAAAQADCVISTGGVSVGEADFVKAAVEQLGRLSLWKLAIKPGKPFSFGWLGEVPFFGLPGNPVAVFVTFLVLVKPFLLKMQGIQGSPQTGYPVRAGFRVEEPGTRREYLRVRLEAREGEVPVAVLYPDQSSSVLTSLSWAEGLAVVPAGKVVQPGELLSYLPFRGLL
jgi:molybdopterin molybdotransferase